MTEHIFDVLLEEALGGAEPPDLTDKILAALQERRIRETERRRDAETESQREPLFGTPPAPRPILVPVAQPTRAPDLSVAPSLRPSLASGGPATVAPTLRGGDERSPMATASPSRSAGATLSFWLPLALAASLLIAVGAYWAVHQSPDALPAVAERASDGATDGATGPVVAATPRLTDGGHKRRVELSSKSIAAESPRVAETSTSGGPPDGEAMNEDHRPISSDQSPPNQTPSNQALANTVAPDRTKPADDVDPGTSRNAVATPSLENALENALSSSATTDADVIASINASLASRWKESGVRPSPAATESEWCRRVYLDSIGRIPTVEELERFLIDNRRDKRARLVEKLLDDDHYVESYARFWTTLWTNLLIGRTGGMEPNSPVSREGLEQYLRRSFLANKPYNRLVYELISAQGSNRPGAQDYNGAVNFLLAQMQEKATPATAKTAQIFLGLQVQCTQCHNHPFNEWKQNRFWELNAFFRQAREERTIEGNQLKLVRLVDADFAGEGGDPREAEVYFELRNGIMQVAYPKFIDGTAIDPSGLVSVVDRREELARLVSRSEELKLAIVNRVWSHFLGYGFTKPVDDMGPHNPPSHPELLARLADEFAGHGYDLKRLIRWITLSDAYALSSKFGQKLGNAVDDPTTGNPPLFSHFYVRQMSAEQLYDSLLVATGAHLAQGNYEEQQRAKDRWLEQFAIAFGTDENDEATTFDGTIAQTLVMMNGELTRKATTGESGNFLAQVSMKPERATALNELYLAALARRPSRQEVQVANNLLTAQSGNVATALEDIWWALLNSNEFILNH